MPISLTPHQQQTFVQATVANIAGAIEDAHAELNHLGLGMSGADAQHGVFAGRDGAMRHETARVAHEEIYLAQTLLEGTIGSLPLADRAPGREAITSLQAATAKLNHLLATSDVEKQFSHGVAAYSAVNDAARAATRLFELVRA